MIIQTELQLPDNNIDPLQVAEGEIRYLKETIGILRIELEQRDFIQEEAVQQVLVYLENKGYLA